MARQPSPAWSVNSARRRKSMARIIEVVVSPAGETTVQTRGYAGADCLEASRFLEQALGVATAERKTTEFYQDQSAQQQLQQ
jgi:hypothetical protein